MGLSMSANSTQFAVTYEDGRTVHISIDHHTLRDGDKVAWIVARERQQKGEIPPGSIVGVKRA